MGKWGEAWEEKATFKLYTCGRKDRVHMKGSGFLFSVVFKKKKLVKFLLKIRIFFLISCTLRNRPFCRYGGHFDFYCFEGWDAREANWYVFAPWASHKCYLKQKKSKWLPYLQKGLLSYWTEQESKHKFKLGKGVKAKPSFSCRVLTYFLQVSGNWFGITIGISWLRFCGWKTFL